MEVKPWMDIPNILADGSRESNQAIERQNM